VLRRACFLSPSLMLSLLFLLQTPYMKKDKVNRRLATNKIRKHVLIVSMPSNTIEEKL